MHLTNEEKSMLEGEFGEPCKWAMEHMLRVGSFFGAKDFVQVTQAHMMADPESVGEIGVEFLEKLADQNGSVKIPMITDPRGVDLNYYRPLGQTEEMANLDRRLISACERMGILMTNTCINYQTVMAPIIGEHVAFGDTGVVIYSNSVCGARSNFEGGPSALASGLTGRTPRYGLHLIENRRATKRFTISEFPHSLMDWGILGAVIGKKLGSYWEIPIIEGLELIPTSDQMKHFGAAMASHGSVPLFHLLGITPEARTIEDVGGNRLVAEAITKTDLKVLRSNYMGDRNALDVVVFGAPQLSLIEMQKIANLCEGKTLRISLIVCTSPQVYGDAKRMGLIDAIETAGGKVLEGTCFYNQYAREIGEANGWKNLMTNSAKLANIIGGYGYTPSLASMSDCIDSAELGKNILEEKQ